MGTMRSVPEASDLSQALAPRISAASILHPMVPFDIPCQDNPKDVHEFVWHDPRLVVDTKGACFYHDILDRKPFAIVEAESPDGREFSDTTSPTPTVWGNNRLVRGTGHIKPTKYLALGAISLGPFKGSTDFTAYLVVMSLERKRFPATHKRCSYALVREESRLQPYVVDLCQVYFFQEFRSKSVGDSQFIRDKRWLACIDEAAEKELANLSKGRGEMLLPEEKVPSRRAHGQLAHMKEIVAILLKDDCFHPFRHPKKLTNVQSDGVIQVVKQAMDLSTIENKLNRGQYTNTDECRRDFKMIILNCYLINGRSHPLSSLATKLDFHLERHVKQLSVVAGANSSASSIESGDNNTRSSHAGLARGVYHNKMGEDFHQALPVPGLSNESRVTSVVSDEMYDAGPQNLSMLEPSRTRNIESKEMDEATARAMTVQGHFKDRDDTSKNRNMTLVQAPAPNEQDTRQLSRKRRKLSPDGNYSQRVALIADIEQKLEALMSTNIKRAEEMSKLLDDAATPQTLHDMNAMYEHTIGTDETRAKIVFGQALQRVTAAFGAAKKERGCILREILHTVGELSGVD